jgi:hypothetical protein
MRNLIILILFLNKDFIYYISSPSDLCILRNETVWPQSQFLHSCICVRFIYSQDRSAYLAAEIAHRYMNVETGRQNIIILFWKKRGRTVSFLRIHKSEADIYIGFSPARHLRKSKNKTSLGFPRMVEKSAEEGLYHREPRSGAGLPWFQLRSKNKGYRFTKGENGKRCRGRMVTQGTTPRRWPTMAVSSTFLSLSSCPL